MPVAGSTTLRRSVGDQFTVALAVRTTDDLDIASQVVPPLTTLRVPRYDIGRQACEMICARLAGRDVPKRVVGIGYEFVPRSMA